LLDFQLHALAATNSAAQLEAVHSDLRLGLPARPDLAAALTDPVAHLERERPNLAAFAGAALAVEQPQWVWRLPRAAWRYLYTRGYVPELDLLLRRGLEAAREAGDEPAVATCANYLASTAHRLGRRDEARSLLELTLRILRSLGDDRRISRSMGNLCVIYESEGRFADMVALSEEALRITLRHPNDEMNCALRRNSLGMGHAKLGRIGPALYNFRLRLQLSIEMGETTGIAAALHYLAMVKWRAGLASAATVRRMFTAALRLSRNAGYAIGESEGLGELARLAHAEGNTGLALDLLGQATAIAERIGHQRYEALFRGYHGEFLLDTGEVAGARASYAEAVRLARIRFPYEWALALAGRAAVHLAEGEPEPARRLWEQALTLFTRMEVPERAEVARRLAALDSGTDQLQTPAAGGRMAG
jgi:tetratricopeptide (TPR) repeat protein